MYSRNIGTVGRSNKKEWERRESVGTLVQKPQGNRPLGNLDIQGVSGGKVNIMGGHGIGHSEEKRVYVHVSYFERIPSTLSCAQNSGS